MSVIFKTLVGSRLYGLDTPESDYDFKGIVFFPRVQTFPDTKHTYGITPWKAKDGDKYEEKVDGVKHEGVYYSVQQFFRLMIKGNPTLTELLFVDLDNEKICQCDGFGRRVIEFARENCFSWHIFKSYFGYTYDHYNKLKRKTKGGDARGPIIEKFGYDVKMASHAYRIAVQGAELFSQGTFDPCMSGSARDLTLALKQGLISKEEAMKYIDNAMDELRKVESEKSSLVPENIDRDKIEEFVIKLMYDYYGDFTKKR